MGIKIVPIEVEDVPQLNPIAEAAFLDDPFHDSGFPKDMTKEQYEDYKSWRMANLTRRLKQSNARYFKAIDEDTQRIVGFAGWHTPTTDPPGERWPGSPEWLVGMKENAEMFKMMKEKVVGDRTDVWLLQAMAVHPDFQGKGVGAQLMAVGTKLVDEAGQDCYLEATPKGTPLYAKYGFVVKLPIALLDGTYILSAMMRPAKGVPQ